MNNLEEVCGFIQMWCAVMEVEQGEYEIEKPDSVQKCISVKFKKTVPLDDYPETSDDEHGT